MDLLAREKQTELECQLLRKASYPRRGVVESGHSTHEKEEAWATQSIKAAQRSCQATQKTIFRHREEVKQQFSIDSETHLYLNT